MLPPLLEAYIASVLTVPSSRAGAECHNEPLTEAEIQTVFSPPMFDLASETGAVSSSGYTAQLCILYYILLYEDTRLTTTNTRQQTVAMPKPHKYSQDLLNNLPIKFLLGKAERMQGKLEGLYPGLLRLASAQFPHLCLVEDWLGSQQRPRQPRHGRQPRVSPGQLTVSLQNTVTCPAATNLQLQHLLSLPPRLAWSAAPVLVAHIRTVLQRRVPRHTQQLYKQVWLRLNTVYPRQLWLATVNSLNQTPAISAEELAIDPLSVLRCDSRVFRSGPILDVLLYMLKACLAASRTRLSQYCLDQQLQNSNIQDSAANRLIGEVVQSRRRPLLGPSPGVF